MAELICDRAAFRDSARVLGLVTPARGSLGPRFLFVLAAGCCIAVIAGSHAPTAGGLAAWSLVSLLIWQPLVEELLFRGVIQGELRRNPAMRRHIIGLSLANLVTSLAFAAIHAVHQPVGWAIATFVPSLVFGHVRDHTRSTVPSALLHIAFNAGFFVSALVWA